MRFIQTSVLLLALGLGARVSEIWARDAQKIGAAGSERYADEREVLYLPNGERTRSLSFGYQNTLANVIWFNTVSYFGKHYQADHKYRYLHHMCDLVTRLDPRVYDIYYFCSTMIAWEVGDPAGAVALLSRATEYHPDDWFFLYLRGFYRMFFLNDEPGARADFVASAQRPGAHPMVARLAAKNIANDDLDMAISFLKGMLARAKDDSERHALTERLHEVQTEQDLQHLERAVRAYRERVGRAPVALSDLGATMPQRDPFGGTYMIDPETGAVGSTSGRKRLSLIGRKNRG